MASDMSEARDKIISNGFSTRELLSVRWIFRELKQVYHPKLTQDLSLEAVITEEAGKSLSLQKYWIAGIVIFTLVAFLLGVLEILCHSSIMHIKRNDTCPNPSISTKRLRHS
ncbi:hypothetical protein ACFFJN_06345, partial [Erwinia mallotivora]|uniref:hypothetical protein n=1 Tax=Erwinia mallotivora TaxID=69222 RepID=UPI0035EBFC45